MGDRGPAYPSTRLHPGTLLSQQPTPQGVSRVEPGPGHPRVTSGYCAFVSPTIVQLGGVPVPWPHARASSAACFCQPSHCWPAGELGEDAGLAWDPGCLGFSQLLPALAWTWRGGPHSQASRALGEAWPRQQPLCEEDQKSCWSLASSWGSARFRPAPHPGPLARSLPGIPGGLSACPLLRPFPGVHPWRELTYIPPLGGGPAAPALWGCVEGT